MRYDEINDLVEDMMKVRQRVKGLMHAFEVLTPEQQKKAEVDKQICLALVEATSPTHVAQAITEDKVDALVERIWRLTSSFSHDDLDDDLVVVN